MEFLVSNIFCLPLFHQIESVWPLLESTHRSCQLLKLAHTLCWLFSLSEIVLAVGEHSRSASRSAGTERDPPNRLSIYVMIWKALSVSLFLSGCMIPYLRPVYKWQCCPKISTRFCHTIQFYFLNLVFIDLFSSFCI